MIAAGTVAPATTTAPFEVPDGPPGSGLEAGELIRRLRDEERW